MGRKVKMMLDVTPLSEKKPLTQMQYAEKLGYVLQRAEYIIREKMSEKL